jgi:DNA (cytosine-5)-methyltransferase 1
LRYLSVCSGIEAATVAWHPLGWQAVAYSEIEKFPSEVLAHHYPNTPNVGDMTKFKEWNLGTNVNLLVGGTPCQSFSVAGLRKGLDDPRGNLMLTYLAIAKRYRPNWLVWENVPGVLSSNGGRDFGSFLGGLAECGYGFAYRVLDAQYFGVAQRRRRVFVVGYLGDWRLAAAVLFERHSLQGHPAPSREKREVTPTLTKEGTGVSRTRHNEDGWYVETPVVAGSLDTECGGGKLTHQSIANGHLLQTKAFYESSLAQYKEADVSGTAKASGGVAGGGSETFIAQPIPIHDQATRYAGKNGEKTMGKGNGLGIGHPGEPMNTLTKGDRHAVAFGFDAYNHTIQGQVNQPLRVSSAPGQVDAVGGIVQGMAVRRLTPVECERLQGFPDSYTDIKSKGKPTPDGPRYKALGNSMAVPVMAWIGARIQQYEDMQ